MRVQAPCEQVALPVYGGDSAVGFGRLYVLLAPVVRGHGCFAWLPGPEVAVCVGDDGLAIVGADPAGFIAFRQADR